MVDEPTGASAEENWDDQPVGRSPLSFNLDEVVHMDDESAPRDSALSINGGSVGASEGADNNHGSGDYADAVSAQAGSESGSTSASIGAVSLPSMTSQPPHR